MKYKATIKRFHLDMPLELMQKFDGIAKQENRSRRNMFIVILKNFIENYTAK